MNNQLVERHGARQGAYVSGMIFVSLSSAFLMANVLHLVGRGSPGVTGWLVGVITGFIIGVLLTKALEGKK